MIIYLDMDGVLSNTYPYWLNKYKLACPNDQVELPTHTHKISDVVENKKVFLSFLQEPDFFTNAPPMMPNLNEWYQNLLDPRLDIYIATTVAPIDTRCSEESKRAWVDKHLQSFPQDNIIFIRNKHLLRGDILLDDREANVSQFKGQGCFFEQPWNRTSTLSCNSYGTDYPRFDNLYDFTDYINALLHLKGKYSDHF